MCIRDRASSGEKTKCTPGAEPLINAPPSKAVRLFTDLFRIVLLPIPFTPLRILTVSYTHLVSIADRRDNIADIIQSAESTGNICSLRMFKMCIRDRLHIPVWIHKETSVVPVM